MKFSKASVASLFAFGSIGLASSQNIVEVVVNSEIHNTLEAAVLAAPSVIAETLSNESLNLTLFAPDDNAFAQVNADFLGDLLTPEWTNHLVCLLTSHVLTSRVLSTDIEGKFDVETFSGEKITVEKKDGGIQSGAVFVDGVKVTVPDIEATNGVVHSISSRPILPSCVKGSILSEVLDNKFRFSTLIDLVTKAGLADTLETGSPLTLFAPDNLAFAKVAKSTLNFLKKDTDALVKVLTFHVVPTNAYLESDETLASVEGGNLTITGTGEEDTLKVNGIKVTKKNTLVANGVVHRINEVLIPPDLEIPEPEECSGLECIFGGGIPCFSGSAMVDVQDKGQIKMEELQIGDNIAVGGGKYEPVYSFGHRAPSAKSNGFVEVTTNLGSVKVSKEHLLFVKEGTTTKAVAAGSLEKGDQLFLDDADAVSIKSVKTISINDGLYAPFTPSGKYLVNGKFVTSSFIGFENEREGLTIGGVPFSFQWMSHSFEFPHRVVCHYLGQCKGETYDANGLSNGWATIPLGFITWVFNLGSIAKAFVLSTMVVAFVMFNVVEMVFFQHPVVSIAGLGFIMKLGAGKKDKNVL